MLAPNTRSVAGPMQPDSQSDNGTTPNSRVLDRLPDLPPDMLKKRGKKALMSSFSSSDAGGPDHDAEADIKDMRTLHQLAQSNPMLGAAAAISSIEKRIPLLAKFAPQTAQALTLMIRQGTMSEMMSPPGQPPINPMAGGPGGPMPPQPPGLPPMAPPGASMQSLPAAAPPPIGLGS